MEEELRPDALEKRIRLGCGAVAGLALGAFFGSISLGLGGAPLWIFAGIVGVTFAFLALRYGDRFWLTFLDSIRWW